MLGGALLKVTTWQGTFVVLGTAAVALFVLALIALPETCRPHAAYPPQCAPRSAPTKICSPIASSLVLVAVAALVFAVLFAYVAGSPFILHGLYGLTPQQFGLTFGGNASGLGLATQLNPVLLRRYRPVQILAAAVAIALAGGLVLLVTALTGIGGLGAPLVGALNDGTAVPLALIIVAAAGLAGTLLLLARKSLRTV